MSHGAMLLGLRVCGAWMSVARARALCRDASRTHQLRSARQRMRGIHRYVDDRQSAVNNLGGGPLLHFFQFSQADQPMNVPAIKRRCAKVDKRKSMRRT